MLRVNSCFGRRAVLGVRCLRVRLRLRLSIASIGMIVAASSVSATTIVGTVVDDATGELLPNAQIIVEETSRGTVADRVGRFMLERLDGLSVSLRCSYVGYDDWLSESIALDGPPTITLDIRLNVRPLELPEYRVEGNREPEPVDAQVSNGIDPRVWLERPIDNPADVIELQANVVAVGGELHVAGLRDGALEERIDGVSVRDPLTGRSVGLGMFAVETSDIVIGGMSAASGGGMGGVLSHRTREGGERIRAQLFYETDDFGAPDKTFENLDRVMVAIGGPFVGSTSTFHLSGQGTWADRYPATTARRSHRRLLDFISIGDRKTNDLRLQAKIAWRPAVGKKLTFEALTNRGREDRYRHNWSWDGYVETFRDTIRTGGRNEVRLRRGAWANTKLNDNYVYYNAASHTPTLDRWSGLYKVAYTQSFSDESVLDVRIAHNRFREQLAVDGKQPWEYEGDGLQDLYLNHADNVLSEYFVRGGDFPVWREQSSKVSTVVANAVIPRGRHRIEAGIEARYNDLEVFEVTDTYVNRDNGSEIGLRDRYHHYQPEATAYVLDRWEHEGMVLNAGVRVESFSPGSDIDFAESLDRWKTAVSPRLGVAYPVTDRDVFSFHYGYYFQYPSRGQLFANLNAVDGRTRGNPDLKPETSVSYQAAIEHIFSRTVRGQFSVFYRDIFGLITERRVQTDENAAGIPVLENGDYGSARGFVASIRRRGADGVSGELSYTYGVATGVASDPGSADELNYRYRAISELPLDWDLRHNVKANFSVRDPGGAWSITGTWTLTSGLPYTPLDRNSRDIEPEQVNSRRLPATSSLNLQTQRHFSAWGQPARVWLRVDNALDTRSIVNLYGSTSYSAPGYDPATYVHFYTETGRAGGAVVVADETGDGQEDWRSLADPAVFNAGRSARVGMSLEF